MMRAKERQQHLQALIAGKRGEVERLVNCRVKTLLINRWIDLDLARRELAIFQGLLSRERQSQSAA